MTAGDHTTDPVASALSELEPGTRALLDLSLRRALPDQELAKLVAADPVEIGARRERALDGIATRAGIAGPGARDQVTARLLGVPAEVWLAAPTAGQPAAAPPPALTPPAPPGAPPPPSAGTPIRDARQTVAIYSGPSLAPPPAGAAAAAPVVPVATPPSEPGGAKPGSRTRNRMMALLALLLAAALVAVLLLQMAGGSEETAPVPGSTPDAPAEQAPTSYFQTPLIEVQRA